MRAPPPIPLRVRLLGGTDLRLGERPLPPLESARVESLLAYLLLHRDAPQSRQRLAFLLWPDSTEAQARTNLRKVLHNLRRAIPDADTFLEVGVRTLRWQPDAPLRLDVEDFEASFAAGRLEEAVSTYAGELLEGHYDEWLLEERERLASMYLEALERLARRHADERRWAQAVRCAERLVAHDPLREDSHRLLVQLCRDAGDRSRALRAYHACAATLSRELGIEPSPATRALRASLLDVEPDDGGPGPPARGSPFVGRRDELERLTAIWREAAAGRAQLVLVSGEAGIGKTRLVEELRRRVDAVVVDASAYAAEGQVPYGIATEWLRSPPVAARLARLTPAQRGDLARLLPELLGDEDAVAPQPLPEPELRRRLLDAAARALLLAGAPLLLVLDDAQWSDAQSLRLVHFLVRVAPAARLLVAVTVRREELDERHPLLTVTAALQRLRRSSEIALGRLAHHEMAMLAEALTGAPLEGPRLERLARESEGSPLFVVEALRLDGRTTAPEVQAVITGRLARLSPAAAALAGVAATIGRAFTADVLAAASGLDDQVLVGALDELWRRGIVRAQVPNAYDFSHGRIREAAYAALSPPRRREAHIAVARALERTDGATAAALAQHFERAGATAEAVHWHRRAAQTAQWLHAHAEAVRSLERALVLSDDLPPGPDVAALQLQLLTALPAALLALEGYGSERLARVQARAVRLAGRLGTEPDPPLVWSLALSALTRGDWSSARAAGEQLHARAVRDDDPVLHVESEYLRGVAAYWPGRLEDACAHFEAAMERFAEDQRNAHVLRFGQDPELVVRLRLAHALWLLGRDADADRQHDLALDAAGRSTHAYSRAVVHVWAGILAGDRGDDEEVRRHVRALGTTDGAPGQVRVPIELLRGHLDVLAGRTEAGLERVQRIRDEAVHREAPAPGLPGLTTRFLLEDLSRAGAHRAGLALAEEALGMGRGAELWEAEVRRLRAESLAALGAPAADVRAELLRGLAVARRQGARTFERRVRGTLAERGLDDDREV